MYCGVMHIIHSVSHLGLDLNDLGAGLARNIVGRDVADGLICKKKQTTSSARRTCVKIFYGESSVQRLISLNDLGSMAGRVIRSVFGAWMNHEMLRAAVHSKYLREPQA